MRRFTILLMSGWLAMMPVMALASTDQITLVVDGSVVVTDVAPVIENNSTLVPVRALSASLGFVVVWDQAAQSVTLTKGNQIIVLYVGRGEALVNGHPRPIDVPPVVRDNRILIPVRFLAENLGLNVHFDPATRTVTVTQPDHAAGNGTTPAGPAPPTAPGAGSVDPDTQALWEAINQQRDAHLSGTITTEMPGMASGTALEAWINGEDLLMQVKMEIPGAGEAEMGAALHQGRFWQQAPGAGWVQAEAPADGLGVLLSTLTNRNVGLDRAKVTRAADQLHGAPATKLTVEWDNADLAAAIGLDPTAMGEGTTTMTFWLGQDGRVKQMDCLVTTQAEGIELVYRGTFAWKPLEGQIPFPAEILN